MTFKKTVPEFVRFWNKTERVESGCIEWTAYKNKEGYGWFRLSDGVIPAHRYAYQALVGPIPDGLVLDHLCRVRHCVRVDHLEAVTPAENNRRNVYSHATHCRHGHEFTPENTYNPQGTEQICRTCLREAGRRHDAKRPSGWARQRITQSTQ